jgi:hypothetical protein
LPDFEPQFRLLFQIAISLFEPQLEIVVPGDLGLIQHRSAELNRSHRARFLIDAPRAHISPPPI